MTLIRWNPWSDLNVLHGRMDSLFDQVFGEGMVPEAGDTYVRLPVDIRQTGDSYVIEASVPGFTPEEVEVTFEDGVLTLHGSHAEEHEKKAGEYIRHERRQSSFHRQVALPAEVRSEEISAGYDNGILTVTVPRAQRAQPRRIAVAAGPATRVVEAGT